MNSRLLGATADTLVLLVLTCLLPAGADGREDQGGGLSRVVIPGYVKMPTARPRTWLSRAVSTAPGLLFRGWRRPSAAAVSAGAARGLATAITRNPASAHGYVARGRPGTEFLAAAFASIIQIGREEIAAFEHAGGQVPSAPNGGQAGALNRGIATTHTPIVVGIDGDWHAPACGLLFPKNGRQDVRSANSTLRDMNFPVSPRFLTPFCFNGVVRVPRRRPAHPIKGAP
jgi:hypothetical protein